MAAVDFGTTPENRAVTRADARAPGTNPQVIHRPHIEIREFRPGDAEALAANLRPADRDELDASRGAPCDYPQVIRESAERSTHLWVGTVDGEVACIFGVAPINLMGGVGSPWLLGTPLIDRNRGAFIRRNRAYISRMLAAFPTLFNCVDARNVRAIAWLKHMGFAIQPARPMGTAGLPFHPFVMERGHV